MLGVNKQVLTSVGQAVMVLHGVSMLSLTTWSLEP